MYSPFFSIIIPTYNRAHTLGQAIQSVLNQTFTDWELILVDDGSTDDTQDCIESFRDSRIKSAYQANKGVSVARNTGLQLVEASWICLLDSDDEWHPEKLQKQKHFIENNPDIWIHQTQEIWIRKGKRVNAKKIHQKQSGDLFQQSLQLCAISPSSVCFHKSLIAKYGDFDAQLKACEDYDLWLRITANEKVGLIDQELLTKTGGHEDQLSTLYPAMDRFRIYSMLKLLKNNELSRQQETAVKELIQLKLKIFIEGSEKRGRSTGNIRDRIMLGMDQKQALEKNWTIIKKGLLEY